MNKIFIGVITGTHGIKGELKILSDFERKDLAFRAQNKIWIANNLHTIRTHRHHQNKELITIDDLENINDVLKYRGKKVYIARTELQLDTFLMQDLINLEVKEKDSNLGIVKEIYQTKNGYLLKVLKNKEFYIPYVPYYIKKVDILNHQIEVTHAKELIL